MQIWVDADACPGVIKDILYRAAERARLPLVLVANKELRTPPSPWIRAVQVPRGFDVADSHIVEQVSAGDLVITADIPLAAAVVEKDANQFNQRYRPISLADGVRAKSARCEDDTFVCPTDYGIPEISDLLA